MDSRLTIMTLSDGMQNKLVFFLLAKNEKNYTLLVEEILPDLSIKKNEIHHHVPRLVSNPTSLPMGPEKMIPI